MKGDRGVLSFPFDSDIVRSLNSPGVSPIYVSTTPPGVQDPGPVLGLWLPNGVDTVPKIGTSPFYSVLPGSLHRTFSPTDLVTPDEPLLHLSGRPDRPFLRSSPERVKGRSCTPFICVRNRYVRRDGGRWEGRQSRNPGSVTDRHGTSFPGSLSHILRGSQCLVTHRVWETDPCLSSLPVVTERRDVRV